MSKERQRARAARERAAAAERQASQSTTSRRAPRTAARTGKAQRPKATGRQPVYRLRRFPPLPWRLKLALAGGWLAVAVAVLFLVPTWTGRLGLLVVATAALPLVVVLVRDPSRRTR